MSTRTYSDDLFTVRYKVVIGRDSHGKINNGPTRTDSDLSVTVTGTRTGVPNPKYRSQIRQGQCATTFLSASKQRSGTKTGTFHVRTALNNGTGTSEYYGIWCPGYPNPTTTYLDVSKADNQALVKFYKNARRAQRRCQGGVIIGELLETLSMVRNAAKTGRSVFEKFTKDVYRRSKRPVGVFNPRRKSSAVSQKYGPIKRPKHLHHIIADAWLEFAFGWVPTVSDVKDGAEALARVYETAQREFTTVTGFSEIVDSIPQSRTVSQIPGSPMAFQSITTKRRRTSSRYYGRVRVVFPGQPTLDSAVVLGLSVSDVLPTAWELIPWSFLIDYFTNVGDVIDALAFPKADIAWLTRTQRQSSYQRVQYVGDWKETSDNVSVDGHLVDMISDEMSAYSERTTVNRQVVTPSVPSLQLQLPFSSYWKDINIAGLLVARQKPPRTR